MKVSGPRVSLSTAHSPRTNSIGPVRKHNVTRTYSFIVLCAWLRDTAVWKLANVLLSTIGHLCHSVQKIGPMVTSKSARKSVCNVQLNARGECSRAVAAWSDHYRLSEANNVSLWLMISASVC